jgi:hypothetical protein
MQLREAKASLESARFMRRGVLLGWLLLVSLMGTASSALAEAEVALSPAGDGTLLLVGSGWRPGQQLAVSLDDDVFPALADSAGGFEVRTGVPAGGTAPPRLTVRRLDTSAPAFARLLPTSEPPPTPHPLAILFAESLAMGAILFALSAGGLGALTVALRSAIARQRTHG